MQSSEQLIYIELCQFGFHESQDYGTWSARYHYSSGRRDGSIATSLRNLLSEVPEFSEKYYGKDIRFRILGGSEIRIEHDLISILQKNKGAKGIDISGCVLEDLQIGAQESKCFRDQFYSQHRHDPEWYDRWPIPGLDLSGIVAVGTRFDRSDLSQVKIEHANLAKSSFEYATLVRSSFNHSLLHGSYFAGANLDYASLSYVNAKGAEFSSFSQTCSFQGTSLTRGDFTHANFRWCDLREIVGLGEKTVFHFAKFRGAKLQGVSFEALDTKSFRGAEFYLTSLDRTQMSRDHFEGPLHEEAVSALRRKEGSENDPNKMGPASVWMGYASHTYQSLKANFSGLGRSEDASWAHFHERDTARKADRLRLEESGRPDKMVAICIAELSRFTSGYGERPWRVVCSSLATIAMFSVLFVVTGLWTGDRFGFWGSVTYSAASFFAMSFEEYRARSWTTQGLTVLEAGLGIVFLGLFLWTISNRASR